MENHHFSWVNHLYTSLPATHTKKDLSLKQKFKSGRPMRKKTPMIPGLRSIMCEEDAGNKPTLSAEESNLYGHLNLKVCKCVQCALFIGIRRIMLATNHPARSNQDRLEWVNHITAPCFGRLQFAEHFSSLSL